MPLYKSDTDRQPYSSEFKEYSGEFKEVHYNRNNDLCVVSIFDNPNENATIVEKSKKYLIWKNISLVFPKKRNLKGIPLT